MINKDMIPYPEDTGWIQMELASGFSQVDIGKEKTFPPAYRKIGNKVYIRGVVKYNQTDGTTKFPLKNPIPYPPSDITYKIAATGGTRVARVGVQSNGTLFVDWIYNLSSDLQHITDVAWIELDMEYLVD